MTRARNQRRRYSSDDVRISIAELATHIDSLDSDYADLRNSLGNIAKRIDELGSSINAKIDQRSQPQWQTYIAGAMLLGGMFFAFISPLNKTDDILSQSIRDLVTEHRRFVTSVNDEFTRRNDMFVNSKTHSDLVDRINRTDKHNETDQVELKELIARVSARLTATEERFVKMNQYDEYKSGVKSAIDDMKTRLATIEQTRPTTGELGAIAKSTYDLMSKLEDRIKSLEVFERHKDGVEH